MSKPTNKHLYKNKKILKVDGFEHLIPFYKRMENIIYW